VSSSQLSLIDVRECEAPIHCKFWYWHCAFLFRAFVRCRCGDIVHMLRCGHLGICEVRWRHFCIALYRRWKWLLWGHRRADCIGLWCAINVGTFACVLRGKDLIVRRSRQLRHCTSVWLLWLAVAGLLSGGAICGREIDLTEET
jgi:hypothetical protein